MGEAGAVTCRMSPSGLTCGRRRASTKARRVIRCTGLNCRGSMSPRASPSPEYPPADNSPKGGSTQPEMQSRFQPSPNSPPNLRHRHPPNPPHRRRRQPPNHPLIKRKPRGHRRVAVYPRVSALPPPAPLAPPPLGGPRRPPLAALPRRDRPPLAARPARVLL